MAENKSTSAEERMAALEAENQALRQRVAALEGSAGQTTSHPDQPFRFAQQKKEGVVQTLNIDEVFEPQLLKGKRVLVTGGNRGLGLAMVRALVDCGAEVLATCRRSQGELAELGDTVQVITGVDVTKDEDMATLVSGVGEAPLDVLINNAGYGCFV
jgi:3-oxoacyl-ACP reductase-like protein